MTDYIAMRKSGSASFNCLAHNMEDFKTRRKTLFYNWRGMQPKGSNPSMEDFMEGKEIVKLSVEIIGE